MFHLFFHGTEVSLELKRKIDTLFFLKILMYGVINWQENPTALHTPLHYWSRSGKNQTLTYSGSQSHTTRRGRASCSLWYAPVANVCDLLLFLDENRVIPEFRHFWKVTSQDEELFTVLYSPSDAFPMTWPRKLFTGLNSTGMKVTWLRTLAYTRP